MNKLGVALIALILCSFVLSAGAGTATVPDFSGNYIVAKMKGAGNIANGRIYTMHVVETQSSVLVTRDIAGHLLSDKYPLDGSHAECVNIGGQLGYCKAERKGKKLILESFVTVRQQRGSSSVKVHSREQWELSRDLKTLKVQGDFDFPGNPLPGYESSSWIYFTKN